MKKKWIYLLTALALTVSAGMIKPMVSGAAPVDTGKACSLTVHPEDPNKAEEDRFWEDMKTAGIVVDVYKVADAISVPGYDTYTYRTIGRYEGLDIPDHPTAGDWNDLAQDAAETALSDKGDTPTSSKSVGDDSVVVGDLNAGLYLVIARGADLTDTADYKLEVEAQQGDNQGTRLATIANSTKYTYAFTPLLVSLPSKPMDADGSVNTANQEEWIYDLAVNLKPERLERYGSLEIVKTLSEFESEEGITEPVTFVFEVIARLDGVESPVYNEVESLTFTAAGSESVVLDKIPAMANVTVREIYSGSSYQLSVPGDRNVMIEAGDVVTVDFENVYDGRRTNGHGIKNQFVYDKESGRWNWNPDSAQSIGGE